VVSLALLLAAAAPAAAHHRQTPPVVLISAAPDSTLPRTPSFDGEMGLVVPNGSNHEITTVRLYPNLFAETFTTTGDNQNPAVSLNGKSVVWDSNASQLRGGDPGRQLYRAAGGSTVQITHDATGTSANPAVSGNGTAVAFESAGNLTGADTHGVLQIFVYHPIGGSIVQVTSGSGPSTNPALDKSAKMLVFQSRTDPGTGADTGVDQIWRADLHRGMNTPITSGQGTSRNPTVSSDAKLIAFESLADLAGTGAATTVPQVFVNDPKTGTFARLTNDPSGCTGASIHDFRSDWRIAYMCGGQAYYTLLRANQQRRVRVAVGSADTTGVVADYGPQFLLLRTSADLPDGTLMAAHQVYLLNLYKLEMGQGPGSVVVENAPGSVLWFPYQGIPGLK
jgi:hypothetical protein